MPDVHLFAPCEKALIDPATNRWSLVSIIDSVWPIAEREPSPDDPALIQGTRYLLAPFFICTQWGRSERDTTQDFEQLVFMKAPDDRETPVGEPMPFSLDRPVHRVLQQAHITCRMTGRYILLLKIRPAGTEEWETKAAFPLVLEEIVIPPAVFPEIDAEGQLVPHNTP